MQPVPHTTTASPPAADGDDQPPRPLLARFAPPSMDGPSGLIGALGVNVWLTLLLVPTLYLGAGKGTWMKVALALPLAVLVFGVLYRRASELVLGFPVALLVPIALDERLVTIHASTPRTFFLVAASLISYLIGAALVCAQRERPKRHPKERALGARARMFDPPSDAPPPERQTELPERWRRRFQSYRILAALSVIFPLVFVVAANFDAASQKELREVYPGRVASIQALINLIAVALWVGLYAVYFVGPLKQHRTGDKDIIREIARLRDSPPRPGWLTYVMVVGATLAGISFLMLR